MMFHEFLVINGEAPCRKQLWTRDLDSFGFHRVSCTKLRILSCSHLKAEASWGTKHVYTCTSISLYMYRYFHSIFLMANLWILKLSWGFVSRSCFDIAARCKKKKRSYISAIQTVEEDPLMLLLGACTTPPEATSWLETFARLAFLSQKEVTFKSTFKCVNIRHSLVLEIYFEQSYWCMLGSSQIRNCGSLNLCKSVCMFWYLPNIYMWQNLRRSSSISGMASLLEPPII